jgi:hypothetical protein
MGLNTVTFFIVILAIGLAYHGRRSIGKEIKNIHIPNMKNETSR